jgi:hypothetical protein
LSILRHNFLRKKLPVFACVLSVLPPFLSGAVINSLEIFYFLFSLCIHFPYKEGSRPCFTGVNKTAPGVSGWRNFLMAKKLYVGNLSYNTTEDSLRNLFSQFGTVVSAKIVIDRDTRNSRGFGFVEMGSDEEAANAIAGTNGQNLDGRPLKVNEAMDRPPRIERSERGSGGGNGYSGGNW